MAFKRIEPSTVVTVHTYESLLAAWKSFGSARSLVARFVFAGRPLATSQTSRLPNELRERLEFLDDSLDFLERLYRLEDPRI